MRFNRKPKRGSVEAKKLKAQGKTRLGNIKRKKSVMLDESGKFKKGNPGKAKGTKHEFGSSVKASIRTILTEVAETEGHTVRRAVMEGLKGGPRNADRYVRLIAEYVDGKPTDNVKLDASIKDDAVQTSKARIDAKVATMVKNILKKKERESKA